MQVHILMESRDDIVCVNPFSVKFIRRILPHSSPFCLIVGHPRGSYLSSWDFLSSHIVSCSRCVFCRDTISALGVDVEGASENRKFIHSWEDNPKCHTSPVRSCRHDSWKLVLMSPTGFGVVSSIGLFGDLRYFG